MPNHSHNFGFTLVEMLVALALFTIIATMAVGTLLVLINGNTRVTKEQSALVALSAALDSMSREIRTGSEYYCGTEGEVTSASVFGSSTAARDCADGNEGLSFREAGNSITGSSASRRIAYFSDGSALFRALGTDPEDVHPLSGGVELTQVRFIVTGTTPLGTGTDKTQPTVTIIIEAEDEEGGSDAKKYTLQTTVTQRPLDL